jgi:hypothetical protein
MTRNSPLSSKTVAGHYARGALGLLALAGAIAGVAAGVPAALGLLIVTGVAWRGCPTCWAIGLMHTRERAECADRACSR